MNQEKNVQEYVGVMNVERRNSIIMKANKIKRVDMLNLLNEVYKLKQKNPFTIPEINKLFPEMTSKRLQSAMQKLRHRGKIVIVGQIKSNSHFINQYRIIDITNKY